MTPRLGRTAPGPRFSAGRAEDPETALGLAIRPLAPGLPRLLGPQLSSGMPPHEKPTPKPWVEFARDSPLENLAFSETSSQLTPPKWQQKGAINQSVMSQFPTHPNREFFAALQGI